MPDCSLQTFKIHKWINAQIDLTLNPRAFGCKSRGLAFLVSEEPHIQNPDIICVINNLTADSGKDSLSDLWRRETCGLTISANEDKTRGQIWFSDQR